MKLTEIDWRGYDDWRELKEYLFVNTEFPPFFPVVYELYQEYGLLSKMTAAMREEIAKRRLCLELAKNLPLPFVTLVRIKGYL